MVEQQSRDFAYGAERRDVDVVRLVAEIEQATGLVARRPRMARSTWLERIVLHVSAFIVTLVALTVADYVLEWKPLGFVEKAIVFVFVLAVAALARRLIRQFR